MRTRRMATLFPAATALLLLAGCGGDDTADDDFATTPPAMTSPADSPGVTAGTGATAPGAPATGAMSANFTPIDNSGASGTVRFEQAGNGTRVIAMLNGAGAGVHQGHIHTGTCAQRGGAVVPLEPITADAAGSGQSTSTVDLPIGTVMNGEHIVVYHEAGGSPGASIACAAIPAHAM